MDSYSDRGSGKQVAFQMFHKSYSSTQVEEFPMKNLEIFSRAWKWLSLSPENQNKKLQGAVRITRRKAFSQSNN